MHVCFKHIRACWIKLKTYEVQHPVLSVDIQVLVGSLKAGLECNSTLPTYNSQQLSFRSITSSDSGGMKSSHWTLLWLPSLEAVLETGR